MTQRMRTLSFGALIVGVVLIPTALGLARVDHDRDESQSERMLVAETEEHGGALDNYFLRARSVVLLTANSPAFANVLAEPGTRADKVRRQGRNIAEVTHHLGYLEQLYPTSIGEACFINAHGEEFARVVRGKVAAPADLSTTEEQTPFFRPTFALRFGQVHQTKPYVSPDTKEWVVANATLIPQPDGHKRAFVHFEVTIESFRRAMGTTKSAELRVVDANTGRVVIDAQHPQAVGARLGVPADRRFVTLARTARRSGVTHVAGRLTAYRRIRATTGNVNDWLVVASARAPQQGFVATMGPAPLAMLALALLMVLVGGASSRAARRELEGQATTDGLTGLGNRRKLLADLDRRVRHARAGDPGVLTLFDLNGFKNYNDTFGHQAGDALLMRLGSALADAVAPLGGHAYRPGGDEFCVIASAALQGPVEQAACRALSESGDGFSVSAAFGSAVIPDQARDASEAMRKADEAMYAQKHSGRATADRQSSDVLLRALAERHPHLGDHQDGVAELAAEVARRAGIDGDELTQVCHAAALHDVGKVAIPDAIINKPAALDAEEWTFMRRHTIIGERIIAAAPALGGAAKLVRSSHEAFDGSGYPDGLVGADIPLGARIIAICDAFDAMISDRPYSEPKTTDQALTELSRCAGSQFDPVLVALFERVIAERRASPTAAIAD
jgi:diguanylate cyclase (GGDEF)-like protein